MGEAKLLGKVATKQIGGKTVWLNARKMEDCFLVVVGTKGTCLVWRGAR